MHTYTSIYTSEKITDCLIYCILSKGEVIRYHKFISVVVIELLVRCLNTGPEDRLEMSFEEFLDGHHSSHLGYRIGTILAILNHLPPSFSLIWHLHGWKFKIFKILYFRKSDLKTCTKLTKYSVSNFNGQLSLDRLKINQRRYYNLPLIQHFEADFLCIWALTHENLSSGLAGSDQRFSYLLIGKYHNLNMLQAKF